MLFQSKQKRIPIIFVLLVSSIQNMLKSTKIPYLPIIIREYHKQKCVKGVVSEMTKGQMSQIQGTSQLKSLTTSRSQASAKMMS